MAKYQPGDIATYYFIVVEDGARTRIQAWTDNKQLAKFYLEFHNCKEYNLKSVTKTIEEIYAITEENRHDEIMLANLVVRDPDHKKGKSETKTMLVPITETERMFISEESQSFLASRIGYGYMNEVIPYLKDKWQKVLQDIMMVDIINTVVHNKPSTLVQSITMDQLMVLIKSFPDHFGQ